MKYKVFGFSIGEEIVEANSSEDAHKIAVDLESYWSGQIGNFSDPCTLDQVVLLDNPKSPKKDKPK